MEKSLVPEKPLACNYQAAVKPVLNKLEITCISASTRLTTRSVLPDRLNHSLPKDTIQTPNPKSTSIPNNDTSCRRQQYTRDSYIIMPTARHFHSTGKSSKAKMGTTAISQQAAFLIQLHHPEFLPRPNLCLHVCHTSSRLDSAPY